MAQLIFNEGNNPHTVAHQKPQLLVNILDGMAYTRPQALYAEFPVSATTYADGFFKVNYADFANAVNGMAWWLETNLGRGENFETLAYIGPNDIRYNSLLFGAVKTGYKMFFTSPRNSIPAHRHLFNSLGCQTMLTSSPAPPVVNAIVGAHPLKVLEVPSVHDLLHKKYPHYPYNKTFEEAKDDPLLALHTSGTTGIPKALVWTHGWAAGFQMWSQMDPAEGFESRDRYYQGNRLFPLLPAFHAGGSYATVFAPLFNQTSVIFPLSGAIPSAHGLAEGLKYTKADIALLAPPWIEEICKDPELLEFLSKNLDTIMYSGGDIPQSYGDVLFGKMKNFFTLIGNTESGLYPSFMTGADWMWFQVNERAGIEFRYQSDDLYEAYIIRKKDAKEQPVFKLYKDIQEYASGDLYAAHPTKPGLWAYRGRSDDIIVFLTGEKTNPTSMEQHIAKHPEVKTAIVIGSLRFQAALMVELASEQPLSVAERAAVIERLWPTIEEANAECPAHAKIAKSHILIVSPEKPMQRAGKGTIQKKPTVDLYATELDALYEDAEKMAVGISTESEALHGIIDVKDTEKVVSFIRDSVAEITKWSKVDDDQNWFIFGMDSLQALILTRKLKSALALPSLAITTIYTNPLVSTLSKAISELSKEEEASKASNDQSRQQLIESLLEENKALIDHIATSTNSKPLLEKENGITLQSNGTISYSNGIVSRKHVVVLTGSTGALGSYILQLLLDTSSVSHVYCLNRSADSELLQIQRNKVRGLPTDFSADRVSFLTANLESPFLGLDEKVYAEILASATEIIHNAWPVNFNLSLPTFRPQLSGAVKLIELSATGANSPSILFVSSISSVASYRAESSAVPEKIIHDSTVPAPMGYGESKYIAERLLDYAASKLNISASIARVGQVAGPINSTGHWNKAEWLPSLIISSLHIGAVPETLGSGDTKIDWVPIDVLAEALIELSFKVGKGAQVFHPLNPRPTTWSALLPAVIESLSGAQSILPAVAQKVLPGKTIETVSFNTWLQRIRAETEATAATSDKAKLEALLEASPAIKLLPFYESIVDSDQWVSLQTSKTEAESGKLSSLEGIKPEWMKLWAKGWFS
ncbi:Non-canonical non-ribosomal peptide synthetase FUB8 [Lachnellula arida]|uniref:Non-canonical non-ribosomal peptide synthetase FUB8 n=1 Tax=Lachnellula arida TaxID=1316785 RepID=A0A8T9B9Z6_9HELO|nr:Non-canonical non-ribosomal peptide synthetase FUB8 [Lachnellula arida]